MSAPRTRRRWIEMLRKTAGMEPAEPRAALDDAQLFAARERAEHSTEDAERLAERVVAASTRQQGLVETAAERSTQLVTRAEAARSGIGRLREVLDRLGVVALNAGLEGARTTEAHGRALSLIAEEVRAQVGRGLEAAREVSSNADELTQGAADVASRLTAIEREIAGIIAEITTLKTAAQDALAALRDLEKRLAKATGLDPEAARLVSEAGDHAKGLVSALTALEASKGRDATRALGPLLARLQDLLGTVGPSEPPPSSDDGAAG